MPVDDHSCWIFCYCWNPDRPLTDRERDGGARSERAGPEDAGHRTAHGERSRGACAALVGRFLPDEPVMRVMFEGAIVAEARTADITASSSLL